MEDVLIVFNNANGDIAHQYKAIDSGCQFNTILVVWGSRH